LFGVLHLPSLLLVTLTMVAAAAWIGLYTRSRRLAPLIASHVLLFTVAYGALPHRLTYHMKVGVSTNDERVTYAVLDKPEVRAWLNAMDDVSPGLDRPRVGTRDDALIRWLFEEILRRRPTRSEADRWSDALDQWTPIQLAEILFTSEEYRDLHRPDPPTFAPDATSTNLTFAFSPSSDQDGGRDREPSSTRR